MMKRYFCFHESSFAYVANILLKTGLLFSMPYILFISIETVLGKLLLLCTTSKQESHNQLGVRLLKNKQIFTSSWCECHDPKSVGLLAVNFNYSCSSENKYQQQPSYEWRTSTIDIEFQATFDASDRWAVVKLTLHDVVQFLNSICPARRDLLRNKYNDKCFDPFSLLV